MSMTETIFEVRIRFEVDGKSVGVYLFESKENYDDCYAKAERFKKRRWPDAKLIVSDILSATAKQYPVTEIPFL